MIGWAIQLWQIGQATVGDIVLITSLALTILHGTRDLAVALVDLTQYVARLEEATALCSCRRNCLTRSGRRRCRRALAR